MSGPRTKRQFAGASADPTQRQITSFFHSSSSEDGHTNSSRPPSAIDPSRYPILPSQVQSNLLSVGMRIRKSVPEGYKTNGHSAFKLWTDNAVTAPRKPTRSSVKTSSRELLPFCGINKVGGLDVQTFAAAYDDEEDDTPGLDDMPDLTFSQESVESNESADSSRKRIYEEEEDHDVSVFSPGVEGEDEIGLRSLAPAANGQLRAMAVPRARTRKQGIPQMFGQENRREGDDFEDASFLVMDTEN